MKGEREDFSRYRETASRHRIPLFTVDSDADASVLDGILDSLTFDLIASISWRRVIPARHIHRAPLGGVNVHRGELPEYAGDKPLHRALRDGRKDVCVTAHRLSEKIDEGEILSSRRHSVNFRGDQSLDENVERIKKELTPFFGPLLLEGLDQVAGQARPNPRDAVRFHADSSAPAGP